MSYARLRPGLEGRAQDGNANDTLTVRSVFVIGPDKKIKLTITYPAGWKTLKPYLRIVSEPKG